MEQISRKLQNKNGASITFALLLFLVCAVVGSVILTAGTAASGRMSNTAEMDQRYYSVGSAAGLLNELINNKTIVRKWIKDSHEESLIHGSTIESGSEECELLQDASEALFYAWESKNFEDIGDIDASYNYPRQLELEVGDIDSLHVAVQEELDKDGTLSYTIKNVGDKPYSIKLIFKADLEKRTFMNTVGRVEGDRFDPDPIESEKDHSLRIKWTLSSIMTVEKPSEGNEE